MASKSDDKTLLLQIFPNEVWDKILENVKGDTNYRNISSSLPYLYSLLQSLATKILFPDLIKILISRENNNWLQWIHARQVCHAWKNGLDQMLQSQQYFQQQENKFMHETHGMVFEDTCVVSFESMEHFLKFGRHFDVSHLKNKTNPFLSRKVHLTFTYSKHDNGAELEINYGACLNFFRKYGCHIWYCVLRQNIHYPLANITFYRRWLHQILQLMPNLRAIEIDWTCLRLSSALRSQIYCVRDYSTLPGLEYLSLRGIPVPIANRLIPQNFIGQSKHVSETPSNQEYHPQLNKLHLAIAEKAEFEVLNSCEFVVCVDYLWLDTSSLRGVAWREIFRMLETNFSRCLTELHLNLPLQLQTFDTTITLAFLYLKTLYLELVFPEATNFLLNFKDTMEEFHLTFSHVFHGGWWREEIDESQSPIKIYNFYRSPEKSNIWALFPKLRFLKTKRMVKGQNAMWYSATRHQWEAFY